MEVPVNFNLNCTINSKTSAIPKVLSRPFAQLVLVAGRVPPAEELELQLPPIPPDRDLKQLQVWERPVALEAELALTLKVLETVANSTLGDILEQPLSMLRHILAKLQACVPAQPTPGPRPQGHLRHWLHRIQEAETKESQGCLEASVTFILFRLLILDLNCVASGDLCV
uniref:Interferon lambda 1 n=1 Tax=Rousettus aegyptiacus TaxID=9407 RepID=A0A7J8CH16_ROUAE|nr:interferon lambda 1 [Rousettus aegyptiacus]